MKNIFILTDWHVMRWVRLIIGVYFIWQAINTLDSFSAFIGSFFLLQALTNTGCCGAEGCQIPNQKSNEINDHDKVDYTIIKP